MDSKTLKNLKQDLDSIEREISLNQTCLDKNRLDIEKTSLLKLKVFHKKFGDGQIIRIYTNGFRNEKRVDVEFPSKIATFQFATIKRYLHYKDDDYLKLLSEEKQLNEESKRLTNRRNELLVEIEKAKIRELERDYNIFCFGDDFENEFFDIEYHTKIQIAGCTFSSVGNYLLFQANENGIFSLDRPRSRDKNYIRAMRQELNSVDSKFWKKIREEIMFRALLAKFEKRTKYRKKLLETGDKRLVYCSENDLVWGIGFSIEDERRYTTSLWKGKNLLGKVLETVREFLRANITSEDIYYTIETDDDWYQKEWYFFYSSGFESGGLQTRWDIESQMYAFYHDIENFKKEYPEKFTVLKNKLDKITTNENLTSFDIFKEKIRLMQELGIPLR